MIIIGIGHKARHGKDLIASHLYDCYGFEVRPFAHALKQAARHVFRFSYEQLYGEDKEKVDPYWNLSPRNVLQRMGTEAMRKVFGEDIWIKSLEHAIFHEKTPTCWAIPDVRFRNEAMAIKQWGGFLLKVNRPGIEDPASGVQGHASEHDLDGFEQWDTIIENDQGIPELFHKVDQLMKSRYPDIVRRPAAQP